MELSRNAIQVIITYWYCYYNILHELVDGNILWCRLDAECRNNYECTPIVGLIHFGTPVKYCCPTKCKTCT